MTQNPIKQAMSNTRSEGNYKLVVLYRSQKF